MITIIFACCINPLLIGANKIICFLVGNHIVWFTAEKKLLIIIIFKFENIMWLAIIVITDILFV